MGFRSSVNHLLKYFISDVCTDPYKTLLHSHSVTVAIIIFQKFNTQVVPLEDKPGFIMIKNLKAEAHYASLIGVRHGRTHKRWISTKSKPKDRFFSLQMQRSIFFYHTHPLCAHTDVMLYNFHFLTCISTSKHFHSSVFIAWLSLFTW